MSEPRRIPQASETIQTPRPSWGPALFAVGAIGAVAGIYANGFVFSAFVWSYIGIVIMLFGFRAMVRGSVRGYFNLPRRQDARPATLPVEQIYLESRPPSGRPQG
ncbi:MAG TPA: hypothetical protein VHZ54_20125 [Solirubrobacterales bacterium]|jgi:hypothetical protein|nr:hypothetical protein [Solirubrobacterales bacterium]